MASTPVRYAGTFVLITALSAALTGCEPGGGFSSQTFNDTEKAITEVVIDGGDGAVAVHSSAIKETRITRVVRSRSSDVGPRYKLDGTVLHVDTACGSRCDVTVDVEAPTGVKVRGEMNSGTVDLTDIATADVTVTSGAITVNRATGNVNAEVTSGDLTVTGVRGTSRLVATSGEVRGHDLTGTVTVQATSGDVDLQLAAATSVKARANSGDVRLAVPAGPYRLQVVTDSGDKQIDITETAGAANLLDVTANSGDVTIRRI